MDSTDGVLYAAMVLLLVLSAFFSSSETALSTVNRLRLRKRAEDGNPKAKAALKLTDNYDRTLSSILVGNNIVNLAMSSIATVLATAVFGKAGAAIATGIVTVLVLTFGEILPKTYAGDNSEKVALSTAKPLRFVIAVLTPINFFFSTLKKVLYKLIPAPEKSPTYTEEELIYVIGSSEEEGVLEEQERELVQSALEFDEIAIHEIITPRVNIVALDVDASFEDIKNTVLEEGYSRIPVYEENIDNIIGVMYSREFLNACVLGQEVDLRAMLSEPLFVHKQMKLSQLLARLKANKVNLAVVSDDYGGTLGIVTMEDVLEELVGEIWDEDDEIPVGLMKLAPDTLEVAGDYDLDDLFDELDLDPDDQETDFTTVNGWALHIFEHIPEVGETVEQDGLTLQVMEMNGHRIRRLRITGMGRLGSKEPMTEE